MSKEDRNIASYKMDALMFKIYDEILDKQYQKVQSATTMRSVK